MILFPVSVDFFPFIYDSSSSSSFFPKKFLPEYAIHSTSLISASKLGAAFDPFPTLLAFFFPKLLMGL